MQMGQKHSTADSQDRGDSVGQSESRILSGDSVIDWKVTWKKNLTVLMMKMKCDKTQTLRVWADKSWLNWVNWSPPPPPPVWKTELSVCSLLTPITTECNSHQRHARTVIIATPAALLQLRDTKTHPAATRLPPALAQRGDECGAFIFTDRERNSRDGGVKQPGRKFTFYQLERSENDAGKHWQLERQGARMDG